MANEQNQNKQNIGKIGASEDNISTGNEQFGKEDTSSELPTVETVKDTAKDIYSQAKDTTGQAYGVAAERAKSTLEEQKTNLATGLTSVADGIKQVGETLRNSEDQTGITEITAKYSDSLARQIEQVSGYFENKDLREMARDVERFARTNPAVFLGSAFALGLLAARFLKSSPDKTNFRQLQSSNQSGNSTKNFNSGSESISGSTSTTTTRSATNPS